MVNVRNSSYRAGMEHTDELTRWLLDTDPALRWQVQRDLLGADEGTWRATRTLVATEGMGAALLAEQDPDGQWAGGSYFPAAGHPTAWVKGQQGQPWTATTWSLKTLREWGLDAAALAGTAEKLDRNCRWDYDDLPYWAGEVDACINGFTLATGTWLGADVSGLVRWFADHQLADGGWNCEWVEGSTRSSFHSTLNALEGLRYRQAHHDADEGISAIRARGEQYLLERHLLNRASTGEQVGPWATRFGYPFRWRYNVLVALDYFRRASELHGTAPDPRLAEAVEMVRRRRQADGTWLQEDHLPGQEWFVIDVPVGRPSPWLTLYALRVLRWWDGESVDHT